MASPSSSNRPHASRSAAGSTHAGANPTLLPHGKHRGKPGMQLNRPFTLAGARNRAHLHLVSSTVSKCHAAIVHDNGRVYIRDLCSRTHVYVNGRVVHEMELSDGDLLQIGSFTFKLQHPVNAPEAPEPSAGQLVETNNGGGVLPMDGRTTVIGRRSGCDLHIDDESVSTIHAIIFELDGQRYVRDLGSRTGTFVNGVAAHQQPLNFNDRLRVGPMEFIYRRTEVGAGTFEDIDELEDLVGTARLGHDELVGFTDAAGGRRTIAEPGVPVDEGTSTHSASDNGHEATEESGGDLIPLASDDDWLMPEANAAAAPEAVERAPEVIDLDADADGSPSAADTVGMPASRPANAAIPPTISSMVVDLPPRQEATAPAEDDFFAELGPTDAPEAAAASAEPPLTTPVDLPEPIDAQKSAPGDNWELSADDLSGGTLGAMSAADEPSYDQGQQFHGESALAEPADFPEADDLGMSAHVIGVMPAQWASGPEATPLAVRPADMQLPNNPVSQADDAIEDRFIEPVEAWAVDQDIPATIVGQVPPAFDTPATEPMPQAADSGEAGESQDDASTAAREIAAEADAAGQDRAVGNPPASVDVPQAAAPRVTSEVDGGQLDASALDDGEIQPGDIDPSLTEAGLFADDAAQADDFDLDELMADEPSGMSAETPPALPNELAPPTASSATPYTPAIDAESTWSPDAASEEQPSTQFVGLPGHDAADDVVAAKPATLRVDDASIGTGLDFLEDGNSAIAAALPDVSDDGSLLPEEITEEASAPTAPSVSGMAGVAVVAGGAAALTAAAAAAGSAPETTPALKRSLWNRLFGRKSGDEPAVTEQSPLAQPTPPASSAMSSEAATPDALDWGQPAEGAPTSADDSAQDLGQTGNMNWPPKSATSVMAGDSGSAAQRTVYADKPSVSAASDASIADELAPAEHDETAATTEVFDKPADLDHSQVYSAADDAPSESETQLSIPADTTQGSTAPAVSEAVADAPVPAPRLRPTIGVAEITLSGAGGFGGQMVLSGAGPVDQLWGFGSGRSLSLPRNPADFDDGGDAADAGLAAGMHAAPPELPQTYSSTPMPEYPSTAATSIDVIDTELADTAAPAAADPSEEISDSFFEEFTDAGSPSAADAPAEPVAEQPPTAMPEPGPADQAMPDFAEAAPQRPAVDPFSLLGRDQGSFFGGMPLPLGSLQPEPMRPSRPRLPFADRLVTMDTRAEMLAEVTMVEPDAMPMFGAPLPPGVRDDTRLKPMQSDLMPLLMDDEVASFDPLASRRSPTELPQQPISQHAPLPTGGSFDNAGGEVLGRAGFAAQDEAPSVLPAGDAPASRDNGPSTLAAPDVPPETAESTVTDDSFADLLDELELPADLPESTTADTGGSGTGDAEFDQIDEVEEPAVMEGYLPASGKIVPDGGDPLERTDDELTNVIEMPLEEPPPSVESSDEMDKALAGLEADADLEFDLDAMTRELSDDTDEQASPADASVTATQPEPLSMEDWLSQEADASAPEASALDDTVAGLDMSGASASANMPSVGEAPSRPSDSHVSHGELVHDDPALDTPAEPPYDAEHVRTNTMLPSPHEPQARASDAVAPLDSDQFDHEWEPAVGANGASTETTATDRWQVAGEPPVPADLAAELLDERASGAANMASALPDIEPESGFIPEPESSAMELPAAEWFDLPELTEEELLAAEAELFEADAAESSTTAATAMPDAAAADAASAAAETTIGFVMPAEAPDATSMADVGVRSDGTPAEHDTTAPSEPAPEVAAPPSLTAPVVAANAPVTPPADLAMSSSGVAGLGVAAATAVAAPLAKKAVAAAARPAAKAATGAKSVGPRPGAAPGGNAPLARKLEKPAGPRRVIAAKPSNTSVSTGFRPPVMPASLRTPAATPPARSAAGQAVTPARRNVSAMPPAGATRDPFTNTGDAAQPAIVTAKPGKRRLVLILVAVVLTIAAIVTVWLMMKPPSTVQGRLQYRGLNDPKLTDTMRQAFQRQQKTMLTDQQVLSEARRDVLDAGMSLGMLDDNRESAIRLTQALERARWDDRSSELVIQYTGVTSDADRMDMLALLRAMKQRFEELPKASAGDEAARTASAARADEIKEALKRIDDRRQEDEKLVNRGPASLVEAESLRKKADELKTQFEGLPQKIRAIEREVARLENLPNLMNGGVPGDDQDAELKRMTEHLKAMNDSLSAAMDTATATAGAPKEVLDAAQQQFDAQVAAARDAAAGNIVLAGYLDKLSTLQTALRRHNEELEQQQKDQRDMLENLRSRLAQLTFSRIQKAWDADPQLKNLVTRRAVVERQYSVASASKLPEAEKLFAELAELDKQIEALRGLIAAKDEYDPDTKQVLSFIEDSVKLVEQSRKRNENRLKDLFDAFVAAKPDMDKMPVDQQQRTKALDDAYNALSSARAQYQAAVDENNVRADLAVRNLTQQVAAQQAKVDARKRELAETRAIETGEEAPPKLAMEEPERLAALELKRKELTEARQSEAKLQNDWAQTTLAASRARAEADQAETARLNITRLDAERVKLNEEQHQLNLADAAATGDPLASIAVAEVVPESATIVPAEDKRPMYSFVASIAGLFMVLMALAASRSPGVYIPPVSRHPAYDRYEDDQIPEWTGGAVG